MKIIIITHRSEDHTPEEFDPLMTPQAKKGLKYLEEEFVRELYTRRDGKGAVLVAEADSEEEARARCEEFPLVKAGLLRCEYYPVKAFRGVRMALDLL